MFHVCFKSLTKNAYDGLKATIHSRILHTNKHQCEYNRFKNWLVIFGSRRSYNTPRLWRQIRIYRTNAGYSVCLHSLGALLDRGHPKLGIQCLINDEIPKFNLIACIFTSQGFFPHRSSRTLSIMCYQKLGLLKAFDQSKNAKHIWFKQHWFRIAYLRIYEFTNFSSTHSSKPLFF